ncbi:hypothetical protein MXB_4176 [Myxobolus squamalis]|nr:hypothetical protein MXB_4176 [Myxobolus squamalis]
MATSENKNFEEAILNYTRAIEISPDNHMYYSNRDEAIDAYQKGLSFDPNNVQLQNSLKNLKSENTQSDELMNNLLKNEQMRSMMNNPEFLRKMEMYKNNPAAMMNDPQMMEMFMKNFSPKEPHSNTEEKSAQYPKPEKKIEPQESALDPKLCAQKEKDIGNQLFKKRKFEDAIVHYEKAKDLDSSTILYDLNISAVLLEQKKYDECIKLCEELIERARATNEPFKNIAKAFFRMGNAYLKQENYELAIKYYNKSLTEHRESEVVKKLHEVEKIIKDLEEKKYIDPEIAEQERIAGNKSFLEENFPDAVKHYSEAIKRNPSDVKAYSNRAAVFTKLMEFHRCVLDCNKAITIDPTFVKSYIRKANSLIALKDPTQAKAAYEKALEYDPLNQEALEGIRKVNGLLSSMKPEEATENAMRDPEVQNILNDPSMRVILETMNSDPKAASNYLRDPVIAKKIEKLISAGIVKIGH